MLGWTLPLHLPLLIFSHRQYRFPGSFSATSTSSGMTDVLLARLDFTIDYKRAYSHNLCVCLSLQMFYIIPWTLCSATQGCSVVISLCPSQMSLFQSLFLFHTHLSKKTNKPRLSQAEIYLPFNSGLQDLHNYIWSHTRHISTFYREFCRRTEQGWALKNVFIVFILRLSFTNLNVLLTQ